MTRVARPDTLLGPTAAAQAPALVDARFRALLAAEDWAALPAAIRRRFSKRVHGGESTVYRGQVLETRMSRAGRWLSRIGRLVGGPLPLSCETGVAAVVTVTEDIATTGQHWTRLYARRGRFPQIIHSSKRFAGPTGLEEYIGFGLGMSLRVETASDALVFRSAGYFLSCGSAKLALPHRLSPGALTVTHRDVGGGRFVFDLRLDHARFGELIYQAGIFEETTPSDTGHWPAPCRSSDIGKIDAPGGRAGPKPSDDFRLWPRRARR